MQSALALLTKGTHTADSMSKCSNDLRCLEQLKQGLQYHIKKLRPHPMHNIGAGTHAKVQMFVSFCGCM